MLFATTGCLTNCLTVYLPYIIKINNFTNTQGSFLMTLRNLTSLLAIFFVTKFYDKISLRTGVTAAVMLSGICFFLFSIAQSFTAYCLTFALAGISYVFGGFVPASILIIRWFKGHRALALGISSAGSSLATIMAPPLLTKMIEHLSLTTTFLCQAAWGIFLGVLVYCIVRNSPEVMGLAPVADVEQKIQPTRKKKNHLNILENIGQFKLMLLALFILGAVNTPSYSHLAVLYRMENFSAMDVALGLSVIGVTLTICKCAYGACTDALGSYKANYLFFTLFALGNFLCGLAFIHNWYLFMAAAIAIGIGFPVTTVGVSVLAADLSTVSSYGQTLKNFQIAGLLGTFVFSIFPGVIADGFGSYTPAYWVFTVFVLMALGIIQHIYRKNGLV